MTSSTPSDPGSESVEASAKPTRTRKAAAPKSAAAAAPKAAARKATAKAAAPKAAAPKAPEKPAATRTSAAAEGKPTVAAADGEERAAATAKPAPKRAPAKPKVVATTSTSPVSGGGVNTPLAPAEPVEVQAADPTPEPAGTPAPPQGPTNDDYEKLIGGDTHDPHGILGAHPQGDGTTVVRTLRHHAHGVTLLQGGKEIEFESTYGGVFSAVIDGPVGDYRVRVDYGPGAVYEVDDPYRWLPTLGEMDLYLIGEGRHENLWDVLGAHVRTYETPGGSVSGTSFAVWAPNARGVRVTGDFDHWSGAGTPMRSLGSSGVWELFVPGIGDGTRYKFQILGQDGVWREKADPLAFAAEVPPATASKVTTARHVWNDAEWMETRAQTDQLNGPLSIYEIHAGSWKQGLNYRDMADALIEELTVTGFTHVEFLPLAGHPYAPSWGY
ncbi:MAG: 1,4-alpha-glucan branching enzyme, partial [Nakamurella sp.]